MESNEKMIEALAGLIAIESVSVEGPPDAPYGEGPAKALAYTLALCEELGFASKNCDNQLGYAEVGSGETLIGVLAHLDVVPAGDGWTHPPYALTRADGRLYGRGVSDDKGPAIASIFAMKDLLDSGRPLNKRIRVILGLAEETGSWGDMDHYKQTEEIPAYGFTPDADFPAIYSEKGIAMLRLSMPLTAAGVEALEGGDAANVVPAWCRATMDGRDYESSGRPAHGSMPEDGENAISNMMAQLAGCPVADFYNACIGYDLNGQRIGCAFQDEESGKLTLNVGKVRIEEDEVVFTIDIRHPVSYSHQQVFEGIRDSVAPYGVTCSCLSQLPSVHIDRDGPVLTALMAAYREETGDYDSQPISMGGGTYARAMDNIIAFGPGLPGRELTEHKADEYILEEDFQTWRKIYRSALEKLLDL